jgi:AcrR family transcriptional regulator
VPQLTRKQSQQQTRDRLRSAALSVIASKGLHGAGILEITKKAGFSRGAFYANYDTKLDLLIDILREKQLVEVQFWQQFIEQAADPDTGLAQLAQQYDNRRQNMQRTLINIELQLEAERNEEFRAVFEHYLDALYAEIRRFFASLLKRYNKAETENLNSLVIAMRLLGLGLGSSSSLGKNFSEGKNASEVVLDFLHSVIDSSPDLDS